LSTVLKSEGSLAQHGWQATGVDFSAAAIRKARTNAVGGIDCRPAADSDQPVDESTERLDALAALAAFMLAYAVAIPFMHTSLIQGPIAMARHGADVAHFVNLLVAALVYGGYRLLRMRRAA
jgi:hypothetical protein